MKESCGAPGSLIDGAEMKGVNMNNSVAYLRLGCVCEIGKINCVRVYLLPATVTGNKFFIKRYDMKLAESTELFKTRGKVNLLHAIASVLYFQTPY